MSILDLEQGTEEWLAHRRTRVTATDFCVIAAGEKLCNNLFNKSVDTLIKDKINGKIIPDNKYFALGRTYEPILLHSLKAVDLKCGEIFSYKNNDRIMASLDGRDAFIDEVIEIKTTRKDIDCLPDLVDYYKFQVAHQCYCSGAKSGILAIGFFDEYDELTCVEITNINPRKVILKIEWLSLCEIFILKLDSVNECPEGTRWCWNEYERLTATIKDLEARKNAIKNDLISHYEDGVTFKEFSLTKQVRNTYKYAKFIEDSSLTIGDEYKTQSTSYILKGNE